MVDVPQRETGEADPTAGPVLRRVIGPWLLLLFIIGDVLGTGIYVLTGQVAKHVGGAVWLPFLLAFAIALLTALAIWNSSRNIRAPRVPRSTRTGPFGCTSSPSSSPLR